MPEPFGPSDRDELPLPDDEVDALQGDEARARERERTRHATQLDRWRLRRRWLDRLGLGSLVQLLSFRPAVGHGRSDVLAPNGHARRTSDAHAACGRHRPSVASSLLPSGLSPSAPCEGIHRRIHDGSWAGNAPWGPPPTTGRGFHPTPKARLVFVLCADDTPCRILVWMTLGRVVDEDGWPGTLDSLHIASVWGILCDP